MNFNFGASTGGFGGGQTGGFGGSTGGFGTQQPTGMGGSTGGGFGFGTQPSSTGTGFGTTTAQSNPFGSTNTFGSTGTGMGGTGGGFGFGTNQPATGGFGTTQPTNTFGAKPTGFGFGTTQPTTTNTFGGSNNPFGTTGTTTGSTGMFGAPSTTGSTSTGFGFGSTTTQNPAPFGGTGTTFGSTTGGMGSTGFGSTTGTSTGFGFGTNQPSTSTGGMFGTGTSTGMGGFGGQPNPNQQTSFFPPFKPTEDNSSAAGKLIFYSITKMDPYKDKSFEEWRWYYNLAAQNKLPGNPFQGTTTTTTTGTMGGMGTTGFGTQPTQTTGFSFGSTGTTNTGFGTTGTTNTGTTGFGFGGTSNTGTTGFGTGTGTTNTGATGFGFGGTATGFGAKPATTGFGFGGTSQPSIATGFGTGTTGTGTTGFGFGGTGTTSTGTTGFGTSNTGAGGFNFGAGTSTAPSTGTTGFGFGTQTTAPTTTGTTGFNFGGASTGAPQSGTTSGFNFGAGTSTAPTGGFGAGTGTTGFGFGTTATAPSTTTGFNFGAGAGTTGAGTTGFNFGAGSTQPTGGTTGFNFGAGSTQPSTGFNFGGGAQPGTGFGTSFGGMTANVTINPADIPTASSDPYGSNPLLQIAKEPESTPEEDSSVISKTTQKIQAQTRPRTFKKSTKSTLLDRVSLMSETEAIKPLDDLLDSSSFTQKQDIKSLTISFDRDSQAAISGRRSSPPTFDQNEFYSTQSPNVVKPKPVRGTFEVESQPQFRIPKPSYAPKLDKQSEGYYTIPSMDELQHMSLHQLQKVKDFTVGRNNIGEIKFLGESDISGLDLDKIIYEIEQNHVEVYSSQVYDSNTKPVVGMELNKPAIITLYNVLPKKGDLKTFEKKLKKANATSDSTFIHYHEGEWVFKVEHFTKYGLSDDEEDEDEEITTEKIEEKPQVTQIQKTIDLDDISVSSEEIEEEAQEEEPVEDYVLEEDEDVDMETHKTFLPRQLNLDPRRMYLMQANLMEDEKEVTEETKPKKTRFQYTEPTAAESLTFARPEPSIAKEYINPPKTIKGTPSNIIGDAEGENDSNDMLSSLRRSFRVGFLPNGQLVVPSTVFTPSTSVANVTISEVSVKEDFQVPKDCKEEYLKLKYEATIQVPLTRSDILDLSIQLKKNDLTSVMNAYIEKSRGVIEATNNSKFPDNIKQLAMNREKFEQSVWNLVLVLFGELNMGDNNHYAVDIARKRKLSQWLRDNIPIEEIIAKENPSSHLRKIYLLLTAGRIAESAQVANENKDLRLSSIISQSFSNPNVQRDIERQLVLWDQNKSNIEPERRRIYELLAGQVADVTLSWIQCLGLHLWYKCAPDQPINEVLRSYITFFETLRSTKPNITASSYQSEIYMDIRYQLLRMYCASREPNSVFNNLGISKSLRPYSYCSDVLDCQLTWHLYNVLKFVPGIGQSELMANRVHVNYAMQLEQSGYWQYAIFILLHSETSLVGSLDLTRVISKNAAQNAVSRKIDSKLVHARDRAVREILSRNIIYFNDDVLLRNLAIPNNWVHEALAFYAKYNNSYDELFRHLCCYSEFAKAHTVFLDHTVPDLILGNDMDKLVRCINVLRNANELIPDWEMGGALLFLYLTLKQNFGELEADLRQNQDGLGQFYEEATKFLSSITQLSNRYSNSLKHRVAISEMTSSASNMLLTVKTLLAVQFPETTMEDIAHTELESLETIEKTRGNIYLSNKIDLLQTLALSNILTASQ